jgi:hypothetical protein
LLGFLVDLVLQLDEEKRQLYPNALEEPYLFRKYIRRWIREGVQEKKRFREIHNSLLNEKKQE